MVNSSQVLIYLFIIIFFKRVPFVVTFLIDLSLFCCLYEVLDHLSLVAPPVECGCNSCHFLVSPPFVYSVCFISDFEFQLLVFYI